MKILLVLFFALIFSFTILLEAKRSTKCSCSDEIAPVCDNKRSLTFPNECLAICYGASRKKISKGFCKPMLQTIERNICPSSFTSRKGKKQQLQADKIENFTITRDTASSKREHELRKTRRVILQTLVERLQGSASRISAIDNSVIRLQKQKSKFVNLVATSVKEHEERKRQLEEALKGLKLRGADRCPQNFKFQYHINRQDQVAYRKCIPVTGANLEPVHIDGPRKCPPGQVVRVSRQGLIVKRTCVQLHLVGPSSCPTSSNTVLYQHRVGFELRSVCVPKCPVGFRIKVNPTLKGEVARWCIFGPTACKPGYRKEYQIYKRDNRILKSVCVPFVKPVKRLKNMK